jgi:CheY-like chemotaxis protein
MSHDLRTPLNGILGYAQILDWDDNLTDEQRHGLGVIRRSGDHLLNLINDVLDLSRVEAGRVELHPTDFNLSAFINEMADLLKPRARKKKLFFLLETGRLSSDGQLIPDVPLPSVHTDSKRLRQVLINLAGNATKFTQTGGVTLKVTARDLAESSPHRCLVHFEVIDTGPGISFEDQPHVFEPFRQVGDRHNHPGGTGLGLSISHNLVGLLGGELQLKSQPGEGATFWFELNLPVVSTEEGEEASHNKQRVIGLNGSPPTILVIDDNADNREVIREMLRRVGCQVQLANGGVAGLAAATELRPDCIITDLVMPDLPGLALIKRLRQRSDFADTVIISSSASVFETDRDESLAAGATAFLPKPVRSEALFDLLAEHLQVEWQYES